MKNNPKISIKELAKRCGVTRDGINYSIRNLKNKGIIKRVGPDKGGYWEVPSERDANGEFYKLFFNFIPIRWLQAVWN